MNPHPAEPPAAPTVDISSEAVAEWITGFRDREWPEKWMLPLQSQVADMIEAIVADRDHLAKEFAAYRAKAEAIAADRDRLRTFVRTARAIVHEYAREHPTHRWGEYWQDPMGAGAWLQAEATEIGTARDGGDPKVEARA